MKNIIINKTNMRNVVKYLCAVLLSIGTSASAWGANATYYVWDSSTNQWAEYVVQDENATVVEGPTATNGKTFYGWHVWNPDVYPNWKTTSSGYIQATGGAYYTGDDGSDFVVSAKAATATKVTTVMFSSPVASFI